MPPDGEIIVYTTEVVSKGPHSSPCGRTWKINDLRVRELRGQRQSRKRCL